ncbi:MAG TPA: hypothetical protein VEI52_25385 [Terriglobales bacterium]|nr:hypothetical protein [Terriglobales bacterium]
MSTIGLFSLVILRAPNKTVTLTGKKEPFRESLHLQLRHALIGISFTKKPLEIERQFLAG